MYGGPNIFIASRNAFKRVRKVMLLWSFFLRTREETISSFFSFAPSPLAPWTEQVTVSHLSADSPSGCVSPFSGLSKSGYPWPSYSFYWVKNKKSFWVTYVPMCLLQVTLQHSVLYKQQHACFLPDSSWPWNCREWLMMSGQLDWITLSLGDPGAKDGWQKLFPWIHLRKIVWRDTIHQNGDKTDRGVGSAYTFCELTQGAKDTLW